MNADKRGSEMDVFHRQRIMSERGIFCIGSDGRRALSRVQIQINCKQHDARAAVYAEKNGFSQLKRLRATSNRARGNTIHEMTRAFGVISWIVCCRGCKPLFAVRVQPST